MMLISASIFFSMFFYFGTNTQAKPTPAGGADVDNALAELGVDNSDKQLALTLVWYRNCQMDIHAYQPDGTQIFWDNSGPLTSTGRYDVDSSSINSNGLAVENISWTTAPFGLYRVYVVNFAECSPAVDYNLYVKIDGVTTAYEGTSPVDDTKYEVVSFVYSQNGTSFNDAGVNKAAVDFENWLFELEEQKTIPFTSIFMCF